MNILPLTIEGLVAVLLLLTILYCVRLNGQLKRLKADGKTMQMMIAELVAATETAERAITGLKATVRDADATLGESLKSAERYAGELNRNIAAGGEVLQRLAQVAEARPWLMGVQADQKNMPQAAAAKPAPAHPKSIAAAAEALAARARAKAIAA
jgi:chromosome segregation ATPase